MLYSCFIVIGGLDSEINNTKHHRVRWWNLLPVKFNGCKILGLEMVITVVPSLVSVLMRILESKEANFI